VQENIAPRPSNPDAGIILQPQYKLGTITGFDFAFAGVVEHREGAYAGVNINSVVAYLDRKRKCACSGENENHRYQDFFHISNLLGSWLVLPGQRYPDNAVGLLLRLDMPSGFLRDARHVVLCRSGIYQYA
jgi:hypothetical protein